VKPTSILLLFIAVVLAGCSSGSGPKPEASSEPTVAVTPETNLELKLEAVAIRDETATYQIDVQYPQMGFQADSTIKRLVEDTVAGFKNQVAAYPPTTGTRYTLKGTFDSAYLGSDVLSVRLALYRYTGGAHGSSRICGLNFDRRSGRELGLQDALATLGLTLSQVADKASSQLKAKPNAFAFPEGALPEEKNYATFLISADKVTFIFQEYQVTAYAFGPQEVSISRKPKP
jgi:hypothetical protein